MNEIAEPSLSLRTLLHAAYEAEAAVEARLGELGLSLPKLLALQALAGAGESLPLTQLAERLSCVKSNITQLVDRLETDGYVTREADPRDRRSRLAVLTPAGRQVCADGTAVQQHTERELLGSLTSEEGRQLASLLNKLHQE